MQIIPRKQNILLPDNTIIIKKNVRAGISGFKYEIYDGKPLHVEIDNGKFGHLQICRQVVAKLCDDLSGYKNYKVFFDNWFTTLDLMHHFKSKGIHAVSTIQLNRLRLSS